MLMLALALACPPLTPALLPGLERGWESNIWTWRLEVRCGVRGMETPARDLVGRGTPTRREVGVGERESSLWIWDSISGMDITRWGWLNGVGVIKIGIEIRIGLDGRQVDESWS